MIDDLHRQLAEALRAPIRAWPSTSALCPCKMCFNRAVEALGAYDTAVAAEQREAEQATEKLT